jgi:hypothetical protein
MLGFRIESKDAARLISALNGTRPRARQYWRQSATTVGERGVELIQRYYRGAGQTEPDRTARRTGALARSYTSQVSTHGEAIDLRVGVLRAGAKTLSYAAAHEFGATIRPKSAKYLAIPLGAAKTRAGVARGGPRDYPNTYRAKTKAGKLLVFQRQPKGTGIPLFLLTKGPINIPARPALEPTSKAMAPVLEARIIEDFRRALAA